eukprot:2829988-Amphidinium_carterae.2
METFINGQKVQVFSSLQNVLMDKWRWMGAGFDCILLCEGKPVEALASRSKLKLAVFHAG